MSFQVTECQVFRQSYPNNPSFQAYASIVICGVFKVERLSVINGRNGLFVSFPRRKVGQNPNQPAAQPANGQNDYKDYCYPITRECREYISSIVLTKFNETPMPAAGGYQQNAGYPQQNTGYPPPGAPAANNGYPPAPAANPGYPAPGAPAANPNYPPPGAPVANNGYPPPANNAPAGNPPPMNNQPPSFATNTPAPAGNEQVPAMNAPPAAGTGYPPNQPPAAGNPPPQPAAQPPAGNPPPQPAAQPPAGNQPAGAAPNTDDVGW